MSRPMALVFAVLLGLCGSKCFAQEEDELGKKIATVESLLQGTRTPLGLIVAEAEALLDRYPMPEDHGRIYYLLAHSHAVAGMSRLENAQKVIEFAQKALDCPLDPTLRLRLYICWGDALVLGDPARPIAVRRRAAAEAYLAGLKEARQFKIPDAAPVRPALSMPKARNEQGVVDLESFYQESEARIRQLRSIDDLEMLQRRRGVLAGQLIYIYSLEPRADEELRTLAEKALGSDPQVEQLMASLAANRTSKTGPTVKPK